MKRRIWIAAVLLLSAVAAYADYASAQQKIDAIESGRLPAGSRVTLSYPEIAAWAAHEAPAGVRNPQIRVTTPGAATGTALIDLVKASRSQGLEPGWLLTKLFQGELPVSVRVRITSGAGRATVDVERVEINGLAIDGKTLDFLIQNVLLPMYPSATIGRPFELGDRIERFDVQPGGLGVIIGK